MDQYPSAMPFWDLSQTSSFSQLPEDDFLALLQKQFPTDPSTSFNLSFPGFNLSTGVDPQSLTSFPFSIPNPTPPSSDSSTTESPPSAENEPGSSRRQSTSFDDSSLKRKVLADEDDDEDDDEDMDVEPAKKSPLACMFLIVFVSADN
jgi:AP-1-like factor